MKIKIALEWFLNPDHLPIIAGIVTDAYKKAGLEVEIREPKEHYDGFVELKSGAIDIHVNEPLHLFEHYFDGLKSLGCFFETRGGVMIRQESVKKLRENGKIKITTPASNPVTNRIGYEILKRYAEKNGFEIRSEDVEFVEKDFWHVENMQRDLSFDGAWLCFYNFEGVEAQFKGFENLFIDQFASPYPNFSALEFMSTQEVLQAKGEEIFKFIEITNEMAKKCKANLLESQTIFYDYSKQEKSPLMDKIIEDTLTRFETDIRADEKRWLELYNFLHAMDLVELNDEEYAKIWQKVK